MKARAFNRCRGHDPPEPPSKKNLLHPTSKKLFLETKKKEFNDFLNYFQGKPGGILTSGEKGKEEGAASASRVKRRAKKTNPNIIEGFFLFLLLPFGGGGSPNTESKWENVQRPVESDGRRERERRKKREEERGKRIESSRGFFSRK